MADCIDDALEEIEGLDEDLLWNINRFVKGALITASELIQTKRDLSRTKIAERMHQQRRAIQTRPLQSGGTLSVAEARLMVVQRDEEVLTKARKVVEAAEAKQRKLAKRDAIEAAKKARKWRRDRRLDALEF